MRTLHIVPYFSSAWAYGGIPRIVTGLADQLARAGQQVWVLTTDVSGSGRGQSAWREEGGVKVRYLPNLSNLLALRYQFFLPLGIRRFFREQVSRFDLVHIHGCHHLLGVSAYRYILRTGIPYLISPYGTAPRIEQRIFLKFVFDRLLWNRVFYNADGYHALSRFEKTQLQGMGIPEEKIRVIYPGLNLEEFSKIPSSGTFRNRYQIGPQEKIILYLGRIANRKGLEHLLQAFALIGRPEIRLVIAGNDSGFQSRLVRLARRLEISHRVVFTGLLSGPERLSAYVDADLVVYPSTLEAFGLVPCEAILCGTPAIVTRDSGCAEVLNQIGSLPMVEYGDVEGLARNINDYLEKGLPAGLRDSLIHKLKWEAVAGEMISLYQKVLSTGGHNNQSR